MCDWWVGLFLLLWLVVNVMVVIIIKFGGMIESLDVGLRCVDCNKWLNDLVLVFVIDVLRRDYVLVDGLMLFILLNYFVVVFSNDKFVREVGKVVE